MLFCYQRNVPNIRVPIHKFHFFPRSLELSSKLGNLIQLCRRYLKHVAFHALQLSRLSISSMEKLATCIANHQLPADFPPTDLPIQPPKSEAPLSLTKKTITPNDRTTSTAVAVTRASGQPQVAVVSHPVVVVSASAKRLRSEPQMPLATTNSHDLQTSACEFVQIANVSRRIDLAVKICDRCCSLSFFRFFACLRILIRCCCCCLW